MKRVIGIVLALALLSGGIFAGVAYAQKQVPSTVGMQTGVTVYSNQKAEIDASNLAEGYLLLKYTGGKTGRVRVSIEKKDGTQYMYDISNVGTVETLPLTEGNGDYTVRVYEQAGEANKYALIYSKELSFTARNELLPFMYSNQFVNFANSTQLATLATNTTAGATTSMAKITAVYNYVVDGYTYDTDLAKTVSSTYLPNLDNFITSKKGICFDYASLMAAMLRAQGIPCKLVIGYASSPSGQVYHAWINIYTPESGWIDNAIQFDGENWSLVDPTYISSGKKSAAVMTFVGDGSNYTAKFAY